MGQHFKEVCIQCKKVVTQCRCMDKNKTVINTVCGECAAKGVTLNMDTKIVPLNEGEKHLVEFQKGMSGSFFTSLFRAIMKADHKNKALLARGFHEEVIAVTRFQEEDGYWEDIQSRY